MSHTFITFGGIFVFGISGTLAAAKRQLDLFGICFIACVSALGGGTVRDLFIGQRPLSWVADSRYVLVVLLAVISTLLIKKWVHKVTRFIFLADSFGIALFTISSVQLCLSLSLRPEISVIFGVFSVTLGGLFRDIICNEVPVILRKELGASAAATGGIVYVILRSAHINDNYSLCVAIPVIVALRLLSRKYQWSLPTITL
jgi:uncharacterized membrane protein YeiH